jgi:hypothetical protein
MAITSIGYDGTVTESDWAQLIPLAGSSHYGVAETTDWRVTASTTLDRGVKVGVGQGWGHGVLDTNTTTITLQGEAVGSGSRWDMVVARRDWGGTGGVTSFVLIKGTATKALPARNVDPGNIDDQPLALVQFTAGSTAPTTIVDLRCYARNGGVVARDALALGYLQHAGAKVMIGNVLWSRDLDANGSPVWNTDMRASGKVEVSIATNETNATVTVPLPAGFTSAPYVQLTMNSNVGFPASRLKIAAFEETTTSFKVKIYTDDYKAIGVSYDISVNWFASTS